MSLLTQLASGAITAVDTITIELVGVDETPEWLPSSGSPRPRHSPAPSALLMLQPAQPRSLLSVGSNQTRQLQSQRHWRLTEGR